MQDCTDRHLLIEMDSFPGLKLLAHVDAGVAAIPWTYLAIGHSLTAAAAFRGAHGSAWAFNWLVAFFGGFGGGMVTALIIMVGWETCQCSCWQRRMRHPAPLGNSSLPASDAQCGALCAVCQQPAIFHIQPELVGHQLQVRSRWPARSLPRRQPTHTLPTCSPRGIVAAVYGLLPVRTVALACRAVFRAGLIMQRVDVGAKLFPGVAAAPLVLGMLAGSGGALLVDAATILAGYSKGEAGQGGLTGAAADLPLLRHAPAAAACRAAVAISRAARPLSKGCRLYSSPPAARCTPLAGPSQLVRPTFPLRSAAITSLAYYLAVHVLGLLSQSEGRGLVTSLFVAHSLAESVSGQVLDWTAPLARLFHALTGIPQADAAGAGGRAGQRSAPPRTPSPAPLQHRAAAAAANGFTDGTEGVNNEGVDTKNVEMAPTEPKSARRSTRRRTAARRD